jgi:integrase/recombinase XerD
VTYGNLNLMANAGVRDLTIQKSLRLRSSNMLMHYIHLHKDVVGEEFQNLMKGTDYVNGLGELVKKHQPKNLITEFIRRKMHQVTTQVGACHRPVLKSSCETINACWHCKHWLTSIEDLPMLKEDLQGIEAELEIANSLGMIRNQQGLSVEKQLLSIRIEALEKIND